MWTKFELLPDDARIWIFTIQGDLKESTNTLVLEALNTFIQDWTSHSMTLRASAKIVENQFVILGLDQSQQGASGCSIDKLMRFIQNLESVSGLHLLLKDKIRIKNNETDYLLNLQDIKKLKKEGVLNEGSMYFDPLIDSKYLLDHHWLKPLQEGWLGKKLNFDLKHVG